MDHPLLRSLRYPTFCWRCRISLPAGAQGIWDQKSRQATCPRCAELALPAPFNALGPTLSRNAPLVRPGLAQYRGVDAVLNVAARLVPERCAFTAVDVETTGFSPKTGDKIVSIGIAHFSQEGVLLDTYYSLCNPGRDSGPVHVHHLTNAMLASAPRFANIASEVCARLSPLVVAHNASFDHRFIAAELETAGTPLSTEFVCSMKLAVRVLGHKNKGIKLADARSRVGLGSYDAHNALADAIAAGELYARLVSAERP